MDCTADACDSATGLCSNVADDSFCDDGLFCNGVETCDAGLDCQGGEPEPDCCEADSDCDDGDACNGSESYDLAFQSCAEGTEVDCDDAVDCTADACDSATRLCSNVADDSFCDDGLFCNGAETCDTADDCQAGAPEPDCCESDSDCDDGNICTDDICDELGACTHPDDGTCPACCLSDGACVGVQDETDCSALGGIFRGPDSVCLGADIGASIDDACLVTEEVVCDDGIDDDSDGDIDCEDSDCVGDPACAEVCNNELDDDQDGDIDCEDSDCVDDPACL